MKRFLLIMFGLMALAIGADATVRYTAQVTGAVTYTSATFTWTPSSVSGGGSLARRKAEANTPSAVVDQQQTANVVDGEITLSYPTAVASEFTISGVTGDASASTPTVTLAVDASDADHYIVTFAYPLFDLSKQYVLRSASGTYLSLTTSSTATNTEISYETLPNVFTLACTANGKYTFTDIADNTLHIGVGSNTWSASKTTNSEWTIKAVDGEDGAYYIMKDDSHYLGNATATATGKGIFTDQTSAVKWYFETPSATWPNFCTGYIVPKSDYDLIAGSVFGPTLTQVSTYKTAIAAITAPSYDTNKTWAENVAAVDALIEPVEDAVKADWATSFPTTQGKYIIRQVLSDRGYYISDNGTNVVTTSADSKYIAANVWEFIPTATAGNFKMRNRATGKFLQMSSTASGDMTLLTSINRDNATEISVANISGTAKGAIHNSSITDLTSDISSFHASVNSNKVITYKGDGDHSYWYFYPIDTDILEESANFLIKANDGYYHSGKVTYMSSTIATSDDGSKLKMTQKELADGDNSIVWNFTASTTEGAPSYAYKLSTQTSIATEDAKYLNEYNSFSSTGSDWYVRLYTQNSVVRYCITNNSGDLPQQGLNDGSGKGQFVSLYQSNDNGSSWRFVKLDRELEDAQYNLNAVLTPYEGATDASNLFYVNATTYNNYTGWVTETYTNATEWALYKKVADKATAGIVATDFNLPADGTKGYYTLKNKNYADYMTVKDYDTNGLRLVAAPTVSSKSLMYLTFHNTDNSITAEVQQQENGKYVQQGASQTQFTLGDASHTFVITPAGLVDPTCAGHMNIGEVLAPSETDYRFIFHNNSSTDERKIYKLQGWKIRVVDDNCKYSAWQIAPISEAAAALITAADAKIAATYNESDPTTLFYMSATGKSNIETLETTLGSTPTLDNYKALEAALTDGLNYNMPADGRYMLKSCWTGNSMDHYMTDYGTLVNPSTTSYYSIWDMTQNKDDNNTFDGTYTFVNEGAAYVAQPMNLKDNVGTAHTQGNPYLCYDKSLGARGYYMGGTSDGTTLSGTPAKMRFVCKGDGTFALQAVGDDYYACIAVLSLPWVEGQGSGQQFDENIQSGVTNDVNQYWNLISFSAAEEQTIYTTNAKNNKECYVGGPVTLTNVDAVPCLKDYNTLVEDRKTSIGTNGGSTNIANAATCAHYYLDAVNFLNGIEVTNMPSGTTTNKMDQQYMLKLSAGKTFYMENKSRPGHKGRLVALSSGCRPTTVATTDSNWDSNYAAWSMEGTTTEGLYYIKNKATGQYIASHTATSGKDMVMVAGTTSAAKIALEEVVPGIYLIYDATDGVTEKYMTVNGSNQLTYYSVYELSTMWKIYSKNTLDDVKASAPADLATTPQSIPSYDGSGTQSGSVNASYITTFSNVLTTEVSSKASDGKLYSPFYASKITYTSEGKWEITLTQVPNINTTTNGDNRYMAPSVGYVLLGTDAAMGSSMSMSSVDITSETYKADNIGSSNLLAANTSSTLITDDNYRSIYVLSYVATGTQVGTLNGTPVYGTGTGFYHLKKGKTLAAGKAYLPSSNLPSSARSMAEAATGEDTALGFSLKFVMDNGKTTYINAPVVEQTGGVEGDMNIYDLNGRVVENPEKGQVYILNGKKVLF